MMIAAQSTARAPVPNQSMRRNSRRRSVPGTLVRRIADWSRARLTARQRRREIESLLMADDYILRDIGVSRYELRREILGL